ncbi:MAG: ABC transporter permease [Microbacterium sp.]
MLLFVLRRIGSGVGLLLAVSVGTFFLAHLATPDPTALLLGASATDAQRDALALRIGTDRPLLVQLWDWLTHAIAGDFGTSWRSFQPVGAELAIKVPVTLSVVALATILSAVFGAVFGLISGLRPGSVVDRVLSWVSIVLYSLPGFWLSFVLVIWFAIDLAWFPAVGYVDPSVSVVGWLSSIALPAVSLALGAIVMIAEQLRNAMVTNASRDYVRTLRSRGLSNGRVSVHLLRNSAPEALTILAVLFVGLLSGAVVVESIFALPGIGVLTNSASQTGDIPVVLGITVVSVVFVVVVNVLLDLALAWLNPKVRASL